MNNKLGKFLIDRDDEVERTTGLMAEERYVRACSKDGYPPHCSHSISSYDQHLRHPAQACKPCNPDEDEEVEDADEEGEGHATKYDAEEEEPAAPHAAGRWQLLNPLPRAQDVHGKCSTRCLGCTGDDGGEAGQVELVEDANSSGALVRQGLCRRLRRIGNADCTGHEAGEEGGQPQDLAGHHGKAPCMIDYPRPG